MRVGVWFIMGAGRRRMISMSNTRKMTAKRKNRREKGSRAEFLGSNPHSKGESLFRSWLERAAKAHESKKMRVEIKVARETIKRARCMGFRRWG